MKKQYKECLLALGTMGLIACSDSMSLTQNNLSTDKITFSASIKNGWDANSATAGQRATSRVVDAANEHGALKVQANFSKPLYLLPVEQEGIHVWNKNNQPVTRGGKLLCDVGQERVMTTRGAKKDNLSDYNDFGVTAIYPSSGNYSVLLDNKQATPSNSNGQGSSTTWHVADADNPVWPFDAQVSFHAYAPYSASASMLSSTPDANNVLTTIHYTASTGTDIINQPDLIVATNSGTRTKSTANQPVDLQFSHALTAVTFAMSSDLADVVGTGANLEKIRLVGIPNQGDCQLMAQDGIHTSASHNWTSVSGSETYEFDLSGKNVTVGQNMALTSGDQTLMIIPQTLPSDAKVEFYFKVNGVSQTLSVTLANQEWAAGSSIIYKLSAKAFNTLDATSINYPDGWTASAYPKSAFAADDAIGLYVVDNNDNVIAENLKVTKQADGSWSLPSSQLRLSKYKYFAYYPYSDTKPTVTASATDAATFFADKISNWTPSADQSSDASAIVSQDLQVATGTVGADASTLTFNMAHQMGLAVLDLTAKDVVTTRRFVNNNYTYYYPNLENRATSVSASDYTDSSEKTSVQASNNFEGTNKPYLTNTANRYVQIVKPNTDIEYKAADQENTPRSAWGTLTACKFNAGAGAVAQKSITTDAEFYYLARVYSYAGSGREEVEEFSAPVSAEYKLECWGSQGGTLQSFHKPGKGGYCMGYYDMKKGGKMYICCGNHGAYGSYSYNNNLGRNLRTGMPGGGATHISINAGGELKSFSSHPKDILLVAAGGGSADMISSVKDGIGGDGGGDNGGKGSNSGEDENENGDGASQNLGGKTSQKYTTGGGYCDGKFGLGGVGWDLNNDHGAQGGSGYYGGGGTAYAGTSGGGSSYYGGVKNGKTIAGDSEMPNPSDGTEIGHSDVGKCIISWFLRD